MLDRFPYEISHVETTFYTWRDLAENSRFLLANAIERMTGISVSSVPRLSYKIYVESLKVF